MKVMAQLKQRWPFKDFSYYEVIVLSFNTAEMSPSEIKEKLKWETSEEGEWVVKNSVYRPVWNRNPNEDFYGSVYTLEAYLTPEKYTYWKLKFG